MDDRSAELARTANWPLVFCMACVMLCEGFDIIIYSSLIPVLIDDAGMGVSKATAGIIGSMTFLGMVVGGVSAGAVKRRLGYVRTVFFGVVWFSLAVVATAFAPGAAALGLLRALAGLGLGVVLPVAMSCARGYASQSMAALVISVVMTGIPFGGLVAALCCASPLLSFGWRPLMFLAGLIGLVLTAVLGPRVGRLVATSGRLPGDQPDGFFGGRVAAERLESASASMVDGRSGGARVRFEGRSLLLLCLLCATTFLFLMGYYGLSTWLVQLMREFELPLDNSLQMMLVLNFGCVLGSLLTAWVATRVSVKAVSMASATLAALCLFGIAARPGDGVVMMALVFFAGIGAISAQNLTNALVSNAFPEEARSAALGVTLGVGRLGAVASPAIGGFILQMGLDPGYVLAMLGLADVLGAVLLVPYVARGRGAGVR